MWESRENVEMIGGHGDDQDLHAVSDQFVRDRIRYDSATIERQTDRIPLHDRLAEREMLRMGSSFRRPFVIALDMLPVIPSPPSARITPQP